MFSWFDSLYQLFAILTFIVPLSFIIFIIIYGIGVLKQMERRAEVKLQMSRDSLHLQKRQTEIIDQFEQKLLNIENILKNVE